jgi:16S rRNA (adenine1518-N6/adenine1519-N6)-dimethyltransferase
MVKPKKHLGQHFLHDERVAENIAHSISFGDLSEVLEVGPGTGVLTKYLLEQKYAFRAFDVDQESVDYLKKHYPSAADKFFLKDFLKEEVAQPNTVVIGNFPYNISSQLFFKIWEDRQKVSQVVCMVQKEVAQRVSSEHGNKVYGILSVLLQAYYDIEYLFSVGPGAFNPPPKVQSGVIRLTRNSVNDLPCDDKLFKQVVKAAFGKRRKTLRNALKELNLPESLSSQDIFNKRAEQLSVKEFIDLTCQIAPWKQ